MKKRYLLLLTALVLLSVSAVAQRIILTPQWTVQSQFAGYYVAQEKGFYKDAEFKEKLDESATMEELLALDYVYVDVEIADGYAIVDFNTEEEDQTTREYKIVFAGSLYGQAHSVGGSNLRPAGKPVEFSYRATGSRDYKVLVNGVETDAESFIPESGKVYVVTYVEITKDRDLGITHVFVM